MQWVPPSLSVPILDLVDVVFQLQDGGWIRYIVCAIQIFVVSHQYSFSVLIFTNSYPDLSKLVKYHGTLFFQCISGGRLSGWPNRYYNLEWVMLLMIG